MSRPRKVLRWADPPPLEEWQQRAAHSNGGSRGSQWDAVADALRGEPGTWAVIFEGPRNTVASIANVVRIGALRCFAPAGSFAVTRRAVDGTQIVELYAKYVGPADDA